MFVLRLLRYEPVASVVEENKLACTAHTDYGFFTLLATDSEPGFQALLDGCWVDVAPPSDPGTLLFNGADMLREASGKRFQSILHRVVVSGVVPRC
jgi:isopenicillin N synthase-like dioxygenase